MSKEGRDYARPHRKIIANLEHDVADVVPGFHRSVCICGTQEPEYFVDDRQAATRVIGSARPFCFGDFASHFAVGDGYTSRESKGQ